MQEKIYFTFSKVCFITTKPVSPPWFLFSLLFSSFLKMQLSGIRHIGCSATAPPSSPKMCGSPRGKSHTLWAPPAPRPPDPSPQPPATTSLLRSLRIGPPWMLPVKGNLHAWPLRLPSLTQRHVFVVFPGRSHVRVCPSTDAHVWYVHTCGRNVFLRGASGRGYLPVFQSWR